VDDKTESIVPTFSDKAGDVNPDYFSLFTKIAFAGESLQTKDR